MAQGSRPEEPPASAFREEFLELLQGLEEANWAKEAEVHGRWFLEGRPQGGYAVLREEETLQLGDRPMAVAQERHVALLLAAIMPAVGRDPLYRLERESYEEGFSIRASDGEFVGFVRHFEPEVVSALHVAACLARWPDALATLVEAAGPTAVERVGRILARRLHR